MTTRKQRDSNHVGEELASTNNPPNGSDEEKRGGELPPAMGNWRFGWCERKGCHRRNKTIATFGNRLDIERRIAGVAEGISQIHHRHAQAVIEIDKGVGGQHSRSSTAFGVSVLRALREK